MGVLVFVLVFVRWVSWRSRDTKDVVWIRALSEEPETVIVSGDPRISRGKEEKKAWHESGLTAFFFGDNWASRKYWNQAADVVKWWPEMALTADKAVPGSGFLIQLSGKNVKQTYEP